MSEMFAKLQKALGKLQSWQINPRPLSGIDLGIGTTSIVDLRQIDTPFVFDRIAQIGLELGVIDQTTGRISYDSVSTRHAFWSALSGGSYADLDSGSLIDMLAFFVKGNMLDANILKDITTSIQTVAAANYEWTVPATKKWIVLGGSIKNDTNAAQPQCIITPSGGTATIIQEAGSAMGVANIAASIPSNSGIMDGGTENYGGFKVPFILDAGDKIKQVDKAYIANNGVYSVVYVEVLQ